VRVKNFKCPLKIKGSCYVTTEKEGYLRGGYRLMGLGWTIEKMVGKDPCQPVKAQKDNNSKDDHYKKDTLEL
jgi:hypothetical protein